MESRKTVFKNLFTGQQWRKRHREWSNGHRERGGEGEMYGKSNMETYIQFSSVQFRRSVVSDSLPPHESQHARPPCSPPTPRVPSDSRPSSPWCHPAISSSIVPFFSCPQSLPASKSFPMSQLFTWGGQSTGASALASFLPKKYLQQIAIGYLFYIWECKFLVTLSIHLTLSSPLPMSISLFSMSVSPLLLCK